MKKGTDPQHLQRIRTVFNTVAQGYDSPALRFFAFAADRLVDRVRIAPGEKVLDVAAGTGMVTVAAAQRAGPSGRVHAIDVAESMLERAEQNLRKMSPGNVDIHIMDAGHLEFRSNYFHVVCCGFGLFFMPDMGAALNDWVRVLQPGGRLILSSFHTGSFQPMTEMFRERLNSYSVQLPDPEKPFGWYRLSETGTCRQLLADAGLEEISVEVDQLGYHLGCVDDWWEVVWNSGYRSLLDQLDAGQLGRFKQEHLAELQPLVTDKGLWLNVEVIFASGRKPRG